MSTEKKPVILFVDVLGVRSKWLSGGQPAAEAAFQEFRTLIAASMKGPVSDSLVRGVVESDSAALTFSSLLPALEAGKALYSAAFRRKRGRVWLRGCIVSLDGQDALRTDTTFSGKLEKIELNLYSKPLLEAIAVEKSGFKGMRLLVETSLINAEVRAAVKQPIGHLNFIPLCKLKAMRYPKRIDGLFVDYLWMASVERDDFDDMRSIMAVRLRGAAGDPEEFSQAAATQVVFHECGAILGSLGGKVHYRTLRDAERAEEVAAPNSGPAE